MSARSGVEGTMMAAKPALMVAAVWSLSACGAGADDDGVKSMLVEECTKGGAASAVCACMADKMQTSLDPKMYNVLVLGAQGKTAEADKAMNELSREEQGEAARAMLSVAAACTAQ